MKVSDPIPPPRRFSKPIRARDHNFETIRAEGSDATKAKRDLARAQAKIATLERELSSTKRKNRDMEEELAEQRGQGEAVRAQRDLIIKGEANERDRGEERESKFAEERVSPSHHLTLFFS